MAITRGIKDKLDKYGLNLPVDRRTRLYANILKKNNWTETQYVSYLKQTLKKYTKKEKKFVRQVQDTNYRQQVAENVRQRNIIPQRYIGSIHAVLNFVDLNNFTTTKNNVISFDYNLKEFEIPDMVNAYVDNLINDILVRQYENKFKKVFASKIDYNITPVSEGQNLNNIRMRDTSAGIIDGYEKQNWDTNTGRCVFDYIIHRYGNIKGFKNICTYENLNAVFNNDDDENDDDRDLINMGVNTDEIERFCKLYRLPMYAIDDNEKCFRQYIPPSRNKNAPAMIFRLSNRHFHPVENKNKIQSITKTTSLINNVDSLMVKNTFTIDDKEPQIKEAVYVENIYKKLTETLNDKKIPDNITMVKRNLYAFKYGQTTFVSNENVELIQKLCENMKIDYEGQTLGTLLKQIIEEATGNEILPKSTHNPYVFQTLFDAKKNRQHVGYIGDLSTLTDDELLAFDITKCYSSCLYSPSEEWIIIDYNDTWEDFDDEIKLGIYYVITDDTLLFKKNGYYSTAIIKKGIQEGIDFKIQKQLIPKQTQKKDLFTRIIDKVLTYSKGDTSISKLIINLMSGLLGQSEKEGTKVKISNDTNQIFNFLDKYHSLENGIMMNEVIDTDYFLYGFNKKIVMNETNIPMYIQVLDESNIKLYDMMKYYGGELVARNTDCIIVKNPIIPKPTNLWDMLPDEIQSKIYNMNSNSALSFGTYRICEVPYIHRKEIVCDTNFITDGEWEDMDIDDSDNWEEIMEILDDKKGMLLQASAGNGKTYTAKMIANKLKSNGFSVKLLAPTNKAALNIGGNTIHKFLKMSKDGYISPKFLKSVKDKFQYIIVDEISMITKDLWKRLCLLKKETDITFLLLGDNKQCTPVENEDIKDYFNHPAVKYICNHSRNILSVRKRYDKELYDYLKNVDTIDTTKFPELKTERNICYFNTTRIKINKYWNNIYKKECDLFIPEDTYDEYTQDMYIYAGLPVIAQQTKRDGDEILFANSETFTIGNIDDKYISMYNDRPDENDNKEVYVYDCPIDEFRKYFLMNYCSTTHKSQGETITENYTIYDWKHMCKNIKYTALSRAKNCKQVCFGNVEYEIDTSTFAENINKKLKNHLEYDNKKSYNNDITTDDIQELFVKQNGSCIKCDCFMKTTRYNKGDKKQFSIDRIDSKKGHCKDNIQLFCWGCNRAKKNRF